MNKIRPCHRSGSQERLQDVCSRGLLGGALRGEGGIGRGETRSCGTVTAGLQPGKLEIQRAPQMSHIEARGQPGHEGCGPGGLLWLRKLPRNECSSVVRSHYSQQQGEGAPPWRGSGWLTLAASVSQRAEGDHTRPLCQAVTPSGGGTPALQGLRTSSRHHHDQESVGLGGAPTSPTLSGLASHPRHPLTSMCCSGSGGLADGRHQSQSRSGVCGNLFRDGATHPGGGPLPP